MRRFPDLPIKYKLTLISLVTAVTALLLASTEFIVYELVTFKKDLVRDVSSVAEIIGYNSVSALSFSDSSSAEQTLQALGAKPHIVAACIYDLDGRVFATYPNGINAADFPPPNAGPVENFDDGRLDLFRPISVSGEKIGTIYLRTNLTIMYEQLGRYTLIAIAVLIIATIIASLIASRLQRVISTPVSDLVAVTNRVTAEKDYTLRAIKRGDDELGRLIDSFNDMLGQIQARDTALQLAYENLEKRVEERTLSLKQAHEAAEVDQARFRFIFDSVPIGISLYSHRDGKVLHLINDAHLRICGLTREQVEDHGIFKRITHPDDRPRQSALQQKIEAGEADRYSLEKRYLKPDGQTAWVVFSTQRKAFADGSLENLSTVADISELKRAQEEAAREQTRFEFIVKSLPVGVAWMLRGKPASRIVNPAFAGITGVPIEQCQNLALYQEATHPDDRAAQDTLHQRLDAGELEQYELEKRYKHPGDPEPHWAVLTVRYLRDQASDEVQELSTLVDITERKQAEAALDDINKQLLETSRHAGMAEVATGVLHNVGNVLNSVNVSATLVADQVRHTKAGNVAKIAAMLAQQKADLAGFITNDPRGQMIPSYLGTLAEMLAAEQKTMITELDHLRKNIEHIKDIVTMQQSYARTSGVVETISVPDMVEDALRINAGSLARHDVDTFRDYQARPVITTDKHKVMQILINLVRNAKYACDEAGHTDKKIIVRITSDDHGVKIAIIDNGVGIPPENLMKIFNHGFTTRKTGHGFGLHSGAIAAKELGGSLCVQSAGPGQGATFILELPYNPDASRQ